MAKKENLEYLASRYYTDTKNKQKEPTISFDDFEALLTWFNGTDKRTIEACVCSFHAHSYNYFRFMKIEKLTEQEKEFYINNPNDVIKLIVRCIDDLFAKKITTQKEFDLWHNQVCEKIIEVANEHKNPELPEKHLKYEFAQTMLNWTIKSMLIMERWDCQLDPIRKFLHIPVQTKIMKHAWEELKITMPCKNGGVGEYSIPVSESNLKQFSDWTYSEYIKFQEDVRNAVQCPIDWDYNVWICHDAHTWAYSNADRSITICVYAALLRIRAYHEITEQEKRIFRLDIMKLIARCINDLFAQKVTSQEEFNLWHKKTCDEIYEGTKKHNISKFIENEHTIDFAQRVLNLTFKNMLNMEPVDDKLSPIKKYLQVLLDEQKQ